MITKGKGSFIMLFIILVLVLSILEGRCLPRGYHNHKGNFDYDLHEESGHFHDHEMKNSHQPQVAVKSIPERNYGSYVPVTESKPIYIPDVNMDYHWKATHHNEHNHVKSTPSLSHGNEVPSSPNRRLPVKSHHSEDTHQQRHKKENPTERFDLRRTKPIRKTSADYENKRVKPVHHVHHTKMLIPEDYYHPEIVIEECNNPVKTEFFITKEKLAANVKTDIKSILDDPQEIIIPENKEYYHPEIVVEEEYDLPLVVEALAKKEKSSNQIKPIIYFKPDDPLETVVPDNEEFYHPEIVVDEEYDLPVVVEALAKKEKPSNQIKPVIYYKPDDSEEIHVTKNNEYYHPKALKPVTHIKSPTNVISNHSGNGDIKKGYDDHVERKTLTKMEIPTTRLERVIQVIPDSSEKLITISEEEVYDHPKFVTKHEYYHRGVTPASQHHDHDHDLKPHDQS